MAIQAVIVQILVQRIVSGCLVTVKATGRKIRSQIKGTNSENEINLGTNLIDRKVQKDIYSSIP